MISVKGKWALVTGASRGIGYLTASFMAQQGCNLILHSRSLEHTDKILQETQALGIEAYAVQAELSEHEQVVAMLDEIKARGTAVDIVFNNAGVQVGYRQDYWKTPVEDFDTSFQINFIAVTTICYRLMPKMIERGFGRVINTTSGIRDQPEQAGYSASKAALDKFTVDLGTKLEGTNVLINLTDPGWCRTDLGGPQAPNAPESSLPRGRGRRLCRRRQVRTSPRCIAVCRAVPGRGGQKGRNPIGSTVPKLDPISSGQQGH